MFKTLALLIEKDTRLLEALSARLKKFGFKVITAASAEECVGVVGRRKPKLVIIGGAANWETSVSMLRLNDSTKHGPVIALVEDIRYELDMVKSTGVDDYVLKPVNETLFGTVISEKYKKWQAARKKVKKSSKLSVLVVDDEEDVRHLIALNLKLSGFEVIVASDGLSGLQTARKHRPDLILLDVMMPDMDGLEVLDIWKFDDRIKDIPVFMLTAKTTMDDVEKAFSRGADDYLTKPFEGKDLGENILNKLERLRSKKG